MEEITQDTATLNLMMHREVDKRVILALHRALFAPTTSLNHWREREIEDAYDTENWGKIRQLATAMLIEAVLMDGSLMHNIRSKIGESLQRASY
jgi:hypothetical protein